MKPKKYTLMLFAVLFTCTLYAATDSIQIKKETFYKAKSALDEMLQGKQPLSYERAIFIIENAYYEDRLDYGLYQFYLNSHEAIIKENIAAYKRTHTFNYAPATLYQRLQQSPEERRKAYDKLVANWSIYSYLKDTVNSLTINGKTVTYSRQQYSYSFGDPLGTTNWSNTQVTHLLDTKTGNCFALASLFKIFSERLGAGAILATAPGHIFIRHEDENGRLYNLELSNGLFPGSGTIETLTYTTGQAVNNNIAMRDLDLKQSIALTLVYLAKGYEYKFNEKGSDFMWQCAASVLQMDSLNLNAMLLQHEYLEQKLLVKNKTVAQLQGDLDFSKYQHLIAKLYNLGYREMPLQMKNLLVKGWSKDTAVRQYVTIHNAPAINHAGMPDTRYASLSWGLFDEEIRNKPAERYGRGLFDTRKQQITQFVKEQTLYNDYVFDPAVFAMNVDPLAHKFPSHSPYSAFGNNPIWYNDPTGAAFVVADKAQQATALGYIREQLGADLFKFRGGTLKVDQKAYDAAAKNFNDNQRAIGEGLLKIVKSPRIIEAKFYPNGDANFSRNPTLYRTEMKFDPDANTNIPVSVPYKMYGENNRGWVFEKLGMEALITGIPGDDRAFILMDYNASSTGKFKAQGGGDTKPCASCIFIHELLDHGLGYIETGEVPTNDQSGVEYQNKALQNLGSPVRSGEDHTNTSTTPK